MLKQGDIRIFLSLFYSHNQKIQNTHAVISRKYSQLNLKYILQYIYYMETMPL